jgi:hypothetical protein
MKSRKKTSKTPATRPSRASRNQDPGATGPTLEQIRERAYAIYGERGQVDGHDFEDWLQAERELREDLRKRD